MATYTIEFTMASGIEPQEQTVEAYSIQTGEDEYAFYDGNGDTVRVVRKEFVRQVVRED